MQFYIDSSWKLEFDKTTDKLSSYLYEKKVITELDYRHYLEFKLSCLKSKETSVIENSKLDPTIKSIAFDRLAELEAKSDNEIETGEILEWVEATLSLTNNFSKNDIMGGLVAVTFVVLSDIIEQKGDVIN